MKEEVLQEIGLSKNEAKVYLTLLDFGMLTVGKIAEKSKVHRANVYEVLERLMKRGLVSHIQREETKYYMAGNPENLKILLREKENKLDMILPQLQLASRLSVDKSETMVLEGHRGFLNILYSMLEYNKEIVVFGIPPKGNEFARQVIGPWHKDRISRKINMRVIYNFAAIDRLKEINQTMEYTEARYLPQEYDSEVSTCICEDTVFFSIYEKPYTHIVIKNAALADSYKKYFELLWKNAVKE